MRPYLAIIRDSFAEALASRVLWILMILITLVLLALAPVGMREQRTTKFRRNDVVDAKGLIGALRQDFDRDSASPGRRIWSSVDQRARAELLKFQEGNEQSRATRRDGTERLVESLNSLLDHPDLYQQEDWADVSVGSEARELIDQGIDTLSAEELARLNRLLIERPFADRFQSPSPRQIMITYFGASISPPLPISQQRATRLIEKLILPIVMSVLVGFIAILVAVLVTAPIIPQMFDPGSLSLLLSKPLSRSLMFLAKFAGGCAFILINVAYLITGLWLIVGLRLGLWNQGLLLCIPIFLFLFAVYYSVSAFAGVIWRNAVLSIVMTVLFWFLCATVGTTKGVFERFVVETRKIVRLVPAGDSLICLDQRGLTGRWKAETKQWEEIFLQNPTGPMGRVLGPVYDSENQRVAAAQMWNRGFFQSGMDLDIGSADDDWTRSDGPSLPAGTFELLSDTQGRLLTVTSTGIERWVGAVDQDQKKLKVFFMEIPQTVGKPFRKAGPRPQLAVASPAAAAIDPSNGNIVIYGRGTLSLLNCDGDSYQLTKQVEVGGDDDGDGEADQGAAVAIGGSTVLLALADGRILNYDGATLELRRTEKPEPRSQPRFVRSSPDGRWFSAVFHNGMLHLLDTAQTDHPSFRLADVRGQGTISAADFSASDKLLVADRSTRVTEYAVDSLDQVQAFTPSLTALEIAYQYVIVPIYWVFPKPGELDNTVMYVLKGEETTDMGIHGGDLQAPHPQLRPWVPVRSSLLFMVVLLGLACVYIERQDF